VGVAAALLIVPVVVDLLRNRRRPFGYLAVDSFYYLVVGKNIALHGSISFDDSRPTNGFHPAWQLIVASLVRVGDWFSLGNRALLTVVVLSCAVVLAAAVVLLGQAIRLAYGRVSPLYALLPVGVYALLLMPVWLSYGGLAGGPGDQKYEGMVPMYGTLWSYANGMESALVILAFVAVLLYLARWGTHGPRGGVVLGLLLSAMVLSRLDTVLIALGLLLVLGITAATSRDRHLASGCAVATAVLGAVLLLYLGWNLAYAGSALPVSGAYKTTFPRPTLDNARDLNGLITGRSADFFPHFRLYRHLPVVVSSLMSAAYLLSVGARRVTRPADVSPQLARYRQALTGAAVGVIALSAYDWLFVPIYNQGHWYWPISTLFVSLVALDWVEHTRLADPFARPRAVALTLGLCCAIALPTFVMFQVKDDYHAQLADFAYYGASRTRAHYHNRIPKFLAWEDGADTYLLDSTSMSGAGLALDRSAENALRRHQLLEVAMERGFDRISSLQYLKSVGVVPGATPQQVRTGIGYLFPGEDLSPYEFNIEYVEPRSHFTVVRVLRRQPSRS
jgi:hypothetical protein